MSIPAEQAETAAFLSGLADGASPVETHISAVFRGADTVWKLKKAVRLGFLDFSTLDARRQFLGRELAVNAAFVPGLYRDVVPVTHEADGLALAGDGPVVDWVLRMAPVPDGDFLDAMAAAGQFDPPLLTAVADAVAAMHAAQTPVAAADPVGRMRRVAAGNAAAARAAGLAEAEVAAWERGLAAALDRAAPLLQSRAPLIRRAHGDLHLGNMLLWQGRPAPFDALEFDEELATIDLGYDLAFLLMDLEQRVSRAAANRVLNRYVARTGDAGLVGALPPFLSLRAMVRAHVEATRGHDCRGLLRATAAALRPGRAIVVAIGGLMGTGKSTLARALAPALGPAPGALILRSDEVRKRLHGVPPRSGCRAPPTRRGASAHRRGAAAGDKRRDDGCEGGRAYGAGGCDFRRPGTACGRSGAAAAAGVPFLGIWLDAPLPVLEARIAGRRGDASDATVAVLHEAARGLQAPADWRWLDATAPDLGEKMQSAARML